jgi:hypothetical protein
MLISGSGLVRELVASTRLTEGLTWMASAIGMGVSVGSTIAGTVVDHIGAQRGFVVPVAAGSCAALIVLLGASWLRPSAQLPRSSRISVRYSTGSSPRRSSSGSTRGGRPSTAA